MADESTKAAGMIGERVTRLLRFALDRIDSSVGGSPDAARSLAEAREALAAVQSLCALDGHALLLGGEGGDDRVARALEDDLAAISYEEQLVAEEAAARGAERARLRLSVDAEERADLDRLAGERVRVQAEQQRVRREWEEAHAAQSKRIEDDFVQREREIRERASRQRAQIEAGDAADKSAAVARLERARRDKAWVNERLAAKRGANPGG